MEKIKNFIDKYLYKLYNKKSSDIAGWSSWQLVGLITQRSQVRVLSPLLKKATQKSCLFSYLGLFPLQG